MISSRFLFRSIWVLALCYLLQKSIASAQSPDLTVPGTLTVGTTAFAAGTLGPEDGWFAMQLPILGNATAAGILFDPTSSGGDVVVLENQGFPFRIVDVDSKPFSFQETVDGATLASLNSGPPWTIPDNNIFCVSTTDDYTGVGGPNACDAFDIFDISNRETFGDGYMHWYANGVGQTFNGYGYPISPNPGWNVGISNPANGILSFDATTNGDGLGSVHAGNIIVTANSGGSIIFQDGTVQNTAYVGTSCPIAELVTPNHTIVAEGGDYAESIDVVGEVGAYEPGDVLVIDPNHPEQFLKSTSPYSTLVAGIYSTKPGYVGRRQKTDPKLSTSEVPMAMIGIVPTKVTTENGPIHVGDLLVTSSASGYAMKGTKKKAMSGAIVGKALTTLQSGNGVIQVLVSLQ